MLVKFNAAYDEGVVWVNPDAVTKVYMVSLKTTRIELANCFDRETSYADVVGNSDVIAERLNRERP